MQSTSFAPELSATFKLGLLLNHGLFILTGCCKDAGISAVLVQPNTISLFNDFYQPPTLVLTQWAGFHDAYQVADVAGVFLIMSKICWIALQICHTAGASGGAPL